MSAPMGNEFWKLADKVSRLKLFTEPGELWRTYCEYKQHCADNPIIVVDVVTRDTDAGQYPGLTTTTSQKTVPTPETWKDFCLYIGVVESYFRVFKFGLKSYKDQDLAQEFITVLEAIDASIYTHKFKGAAGGIFNANIIARDLGLVEKIQSTNENYNVTSAPMTKEEMKDIFKTINEQI